MSIHTGRKRRLSWILAGLALGGAAVALAMHEGPSNAGSPDPSDYWHRPLASQGKPPAGWTPLEQSLAPEDCGQCHADKLAEWRTSRHAHAFSPGLVGQLLGFDAEDTSACLECHAPLAEQRQAFEAARASGVAHLPAKQGLAAAGNGCGGCHLRHFRRFGPPQRDTGAVGPSDAGGPHGGVVRMSFFEKAEFCSACHQFPADQAINGKPLENTYAEWKTSPQAARGETCQTCHMPDRRHLWRGIHDPAMVVSGLTPRITADAGQVHFELINSGVGHAFPTYVTPRVVMYGVGLDAKGGPRPETLRSQVIARRVRFDGERWIELSDSRLPPGGRVSLDIDWRGSKRVRVWLEIFPDDYYGTQVYPGLLDSLPHGDEAAKLIAEAKAQASASSFRLFETEMSRP